MKQPEPVPAPFVPAEEFEAPAPPPPAPPAPPPAPPAPPTPAAVGSTNLFFKLSQDGTAPAAAAANPWGAPPAAATSPPPPPPAPTLPGLPTPARTPVIAAPVAKKKENYNKPPAREDDDDGDGWDVIHDKDESDSSEDEYVSCNSRQQMAAQS
jgi:hypothetical protein